MEMLSGNKLQLLLNGSAYFPALEQAFDAAKKEIYLETYIFADDRTGRRIAAALVRAAGRGVSVHVLVDGFGSKGMFEQTRQLLSAANIEVLIFGPKTSPLTLRRKRLRRLHRKLVVVDARLAFIGGINIIDDMHTPRHTPPRYDYAVRIEGPLIASVLDETERLWHRVAWASLRRSVQRHPRVSAAARGKQRAALVVRDNLSHRSDIEEAYLAAIAEAREEIIIANAYFFPGARFRHALRRAAKRGVRVLLLLQGRVEYVLLHYATRALYGSLLDAGVEIFEYHKSFLHVKVAVIDQRWATVGSSNIDPFSLMLAREANIVVDDVVFSKELRRSLHDHMQDGAKVVAKSAWHRQPLWRRALIWSAYGCARLLMGLIGYGGKR
ncbi:MAG: cardiolipin synthase B [Betaproteobacteria bacterium RIFCSPLOWO2_12_FULL_62_13b]|nr:MAG: cardiolipin synthase B [Betaproteobacteria bacterium RIFCSPLOWO2_12_FULL_62_13b]